MRIKPGHCSHNNIWVFIFQKSLKFTVFVPNALKIDVINTQILVMLRSLDSMRSGCKPIHGRILLYR